MEKNEKNIENNRKKRKKHVLFNEKNKNFVFFVFFNCFLLKVEVAIIKNINIYHINTRCIGIYRIIPLLFDPIFVSNRCQKSIIRFSLKNTIYFGEIVEYQIVHIHIY